MREINSICVYCGCSDLIDPTFFKPAVELGILLAKKNIDLVYGAGKTGLMGTLADAVLDYGGAVIGVIPENLNQPQLIHANLTQVEVVDDIQLRKKRMADLAEGFIALPGGFGTMDEFFEILTWAQIGIHNKPIGLLNTNRYFDPMMQMFQNSLRYGFIYPEHLDLFQISEDPADLLTKMENYSPPGNIDRWVSRSQE
ncbi:MAG TPA: TIGR00730 family Rossman fold protein [Bellilinea sp.]|nr:TIGR00730 family Rossman fold protein [Bellilinea sp.]